MALNSHWQNDRTARSAANPDPDDHINDDFAGTPASTGGSSISVMRGDLVVSMAICAVPELGHLRGYGLGVIDRLRLGHADPIALVAGR